ncbi:MAG: WecB/TagA/CpsF family glycosyltransferase [Bacteroidetes bacterium]|nr:WecB/TagA/CpsF family glycosyltransferase [Bacteroidota bacterium]
MSFQRITIFDFDFISAASVNDVVADIMEHVSTNTAGIDFLITPNAYQLVHFAEKKNAAIKHFYKHATYVLPDGMPIVWLGKLLKKDIKHRLTGSDLFPALWQQIKKQNLYTTFVLPDDNISHLFQQEYAQCSCFVPAFFNAADGQYIATLAASVAANIIKNNALFVFLGLGFPKQELLAMQLEKTLKEKGYAKPVLFLLLGASFEFYFGLKKRAPAFFQKSGLEWLYRFAKEPRRLWKRYTIDNLRFLSIVTKEILKR